VPSLPHKKNVSPFCLLPVPSKLFEYTLSRQKYGVMKGTWMGMGRILRCNPFSEGGFDPVK